MKNFYVTTPIYYVNAKPHIGSAYTTIAADILARWHRQNQEDTFFLTGTDEHGQKVANKAQKENIEPIELCNKNSARFKQVFDSMSISYDRFIRTTEKSHEKMVGEVLKKLKEKDLIYKGEYKGLYCVACERYYTSKELKDGKCPYHNTEPIQLSEECYFFKLSAFRQPLIDLLKSDKWRVEPKERKNELLGFLLSEELEDLAISRKNVSWGVKIPWDRTQTVYVWVDALFNYLSGLGWDGKSKVENKFWPPEIQLIGKDILRFHGIIWPAFLLALDIDLPKKLFAHGFFTVNGKKMSKSLGNAIDPEELGQTFGVDPLRWLLVSCFPFGTDGDVSVSKFYDAYTNELSNGIGNLLRRVVSLALKKDISYQIIKPKTKIKKTVEKSWKDYKKYLNELKFQKAKNIIMKLAGFADKYVEKKKPWTIEDDKKYKEIISHLLEIIRQITWMIYPFMPDKATQMFKSLGIESQEKKKSFEQAIKLGKVKFDNISQIDILFPKNLK